MFVTCYGWRKETEELRFSNTPSAKTSVEQAEYRNITRRDSTNLNADLLILLKTQSGFPWGDQLRGSLLSKLGGERFEKIKKAELGSARGANKTPYVKGLSDMVIHNR